MYLQNYNMLKIVKKRKILSDILNVPFWTQASFSEKIIYSKKCTHFGKIEIATNCRKLYFYSTVFKRDCRYILITLGKLILDIFTQGKITFPQSFYPKKTRRSVTKNYLQQNIVCLKLQIYPSPENFPLG